MDDKPIRCTHAYTVLILEQLYIPEELNFTISTRALLTISANVVCDVIIEEIFCERSTFFRTSNIASIKVDNVVLKH